MIWLGTKRGYLSDWITQRWVQLTGREVSLVSHPWLAGPFAPTEGVGPTFFQSWAEKQDLQIDKTTTSTGIIPDFSALRGSRLDPPMIDPMVADFYEKTSTYELDAWAEWCGLFRPFGWLLAVLFSRRLQQLNVPLSGLDTSRGMTNEILPFRDRKTGALRYTAWYRRLLGSGNILYAGFYSLCNLPGNGDPHVKVVFPLPNGNAIVIMRAECLTDKSLVVTSSGEKFGEPGFYFTVNSGAGKVWTRYVRAMRESIRVYSAEGDALRADHILHMWGITFLKLHYRMRKNLLHAHRRPAEQDVESSPTGSPSATDSTHRWRSDPVPDQRHGPIRRR